jgi:hypothetical protein
MCFRDLIALESWAHGVIWPGFAMTLVTCTRDACMEMAECVRQWATDVPRAPRTDGFDQRAIDAIKSRMISPGKVAP